MLMLTLSLLDHHHPLCSLLPTEMGDMANATEESGKIAREMATAAQRPLNSLGVSEDSRHLTLCFSHFQVGLAEKH